MDLKLRQPTPAEWRKGGVVTGVVLVHGLGAYLVSQAQPVPLRYEPPLIQVELVRPEVPPLPLPPPPPPKPAPPTPDAGGGRAATASRVHRPPDPPPKVEREVPAPVVQAPEPDLRVGVAARSDPEPGMGQGGQGTGEGGGVGAGRGPGTGTRTGPENIRRPTNGQIRAAHPAEAMRRRISGAATINCRIQLDTTLAGCRVVGETPGGFGFGEAALRLGMQTYRFRPPTIDGRPVDDQGVTFTIEFGPQDRRPRG